MKLHPEAEDGLLRGLPPVADGTARVLILGSMPGARSLADARYYAHPHNAFWPIMGALVGVGPDLPYEDRLHQLRQAHIALWDVIATCRREGSLDTAIEGETPNDFAGLFARCPDIRHVFFNGGKAATSFRRHVLPGLDAAHVVFTQLPSTSPAHAGRSRADKLAAWRIVQEKLASGGDLMP